MPIYSYRCTACGTPTDLYQRMSEPPPTQCKACSKPALVKQLTAPGFSIEGCGVYSPGLKFSRVLPGTSGEAGTKDPKPS